MNITQEDIDAVVDRLQWKDDDIVATCGLNYVTRDFHSKFDVPCEVLAEEIRQHIRNGWWEVVRPFLSSDGQLFKP